MKKLLLAFVFLLISASPALAHPGRTAADGCHYCRTNCAKWGVAQDERHCHNAPAVTAAPARVYTPAPTRIATPTPTKKPTTTPTKTPTPTATPTPTEEITPSPTPTIEVSPTPTETASPAVPAVKSARTGGFWSWLSRLFKK